MPIHDWKLVDANLFHDFHQTWTIGIRKALNGGLLPKGFSALVEQHSGGVVPDVLVLQRWQRPDVGAGGAVVTATPPQTQHVFRAKERIAARGNRITIRHPLGQVVCVIEIVSPGNKSSKSALAAFVGKAVDLLNNGIHLLIVDLFPPSVRDPKKKAHSNCPPAKPFTLAAYVAAEPIVAYVEPVGVGNVLPDMPAYLDADSYVPIPLEATYQEAWDSCPEDMRELVEQATQRSGRPGP